jgi:hypothetical protein
VGKDLRECTASARDRRVRHGYASPALPKHPTSYGRGGRATRTRGRNSFGHSWQVRHFYLVQLFPAFLLWPYCSLVPQIVKIASAKVQEAFATHIQEVSSILVQSPTDTKLIRPILEDLLAGQVSKTNFFRSVEVRQTYDSDDDEYMATLVKPKSKSPHGSPKIALSIMKKCVDSGHPHLAAAAITHMLKMDAVSSPVAQARAKTVLLPLVSLLLVEPQILAALPTELFNDLKRTSVELSLDEIHRYGGKITRSELAQILDVAEHSGKPDISTVQRNTASDFFPIGQRQTSRQVSEWSAPISRHSILYRSLSDIISVSDLACSTLCTAYL